jgi:hypothetical protein
MIFPTARSANPHHLLLGFTSSFLPKSFVRDTMKLFVNPQQLASSSSYTFFSLMWWREKDNGEKEAENNIDQTWLALLPCVVCT